MLIYPFLGRFVIVRNDREYGIEKRSVERGDVSDDCRGVVSSASDDKWDPMCDAFSDENAQSLLFVGRECGCFRGSSECDNIVDSALDLIVDEPCKCLKVDRFVAFEGCNKSDTHSAKINISH